MPPKHVNQDLLAGLEDANITDMSTLLRFYNMGSKCCFDDPPRRGKVGITPCQLPPLKIEKIQAGLEKMSLALGSQPSSRNLAANPYAGLKNVGNTCYVNSLLQYLFVNVSFRKCILAQETTTDKVLRSLQDLFGLMQQTTDSVCDPSAFVDSAGITRGVQEDVTEFWHMLMGHLTKKTNGASQLLLAFQQASLVRCGKCSTSSMRKELLFELHVKPPETETVRRSVTLQEALQSSFAEEQLVGENRYHCQKCGGLQEATRKNLLQSLPPYLHVIFDRFSWDPVSEVRKRVDCDLVFPETLDLLPFVAGHSDASLSTFELIGVLKHHSKSAESGHYTATLRQPSKAKSEAETVSLTEDSVDWEVIGTTGTDWWEFNDSAVTVAKSPGKVASCDAKAKSWSSQSAYMLIYRRRSSETYVASNISLPQRVADEVARRSKERENSDKKYQENKAKHAKLISNRCHESREVQKQLESDSVKDTLPSELSVVPKEWLTQWNEGSEVDLDDGYVTQLKYSALLLPTPSSASNEESVRPIGSFSWSSTGNFIEIPSSPPSFVARSDDMRLKADQEVGRSKPRLDPFACWDGRAKVLPTPIFQQCYLECLGQRSLEKVRIVPDDLALGDLSLDKLLSVSVARCLQNLLRCTRELASLLVKIRDEDVTTQEGQEVVWVRAKHITSLLQQYTNLDLPSATARRRSRPVTFSTFAVWKQLESEWRRFQKTAHAFQSAEKKGQSAPHLGEGLCCPHGRLHTGYKAIEALQRDVDRILDLEDERIRLWKEFGARGILPRISRSQLLPVTVARCEECVQAQKAEQLRKKTVSTGKDKEKKLFQTLLSGKLPIERYGLTEGRYALIPATWRRKWLAYVESTDGSAPPPLDTAFFRCEHNALQYNPAAFFEQSRDVEIVNSSRHFRHPHEAAYFLIPMAEAQELYQTYAVDKSQLSLDDYCYLECNAVPGSDFPSARTYSCHPQPCSHCTGERASYIADIRFEDLRSAPSHILRHEHQIKLEGALSGLDVKCLISNEFDLQGVTPGKLLLSANSRPFGDSDTLRQVLGRQAFLRRIPLSVEIYEIDMSEPAPKRQRCDGGRPSLLQSNLVSC